MVVWDAETISRFANRGEDIYAAESNCIIDRLALNVTAGTSQYTLPDYVLNIRKVMWKGDDLNPVSHRDFRDNNTFVTSTGMPKDYIFSNIGRSIIQFYPNPVESVSSVLTGLFGTEIPNRVIVEFYRSPDHSTVIIPSYIRRRLLKCYVAKMCFAIEGKGQNLKACRYFDSKWNFLKELYSSVLEDLTTKPRRLISDADYAIDYGVPTARLDPNKYGIGVDY